MYPFPCKCRNAKAWMRRSTLLEGQGYCSAAVAAMERAAVLDEDGFLGAKQKLPSLLSECGFGTSSRPALFAMRFWLPLLACRDSRCAAVPQAVHTLCLTTTLLAGKAAQSSMQPSLVALCGSHIANKARLVRMLQMVSRVGSEALKLDKIMVRHCSWRALILMLQCTCR